MFIVGIQLFSGSGSYGAALDVVESVLAAVNIDLIYL